MLFGSIFLIILYLVLQYILAWITFFNNLDSRLGDSTWRFSYDYPVVGDRDISDLDDKDFVINFLTVSYFLGIKKRQQLHNQKKIN